MYVDGVLTNFDAEYTSADAVEANLRNGLLAAFQALDPAPPGITFATAGGAGIKATGDANVIFTASVFLEVTAADISITHTTTVAALGDLSGDPAYDAAVRRVARNPLGRTQKA